MNLSEHIAPQDMRQYLDFLLWHYRVVDAFWYIYLEEERGSDVANRFNEKVWSRVAVSGRSARPVVAAIVDLVERRVPVPPGRLKSGAADAFPCCWDCASGCC